MMTNTAASRFQEPLDVEYLNGRNWITKAEFDYATDAYTIVIPPGFTTDFASIPRALWAILPPTGNYGKAAVIHDYLYSYGGRVASVPGHLFTKAEADRIFYDAMGVLGCPALQRKTMYYAVRLFGRGNFYLYDWVRGA